MLRNIVKYTAATAVGCAVGTAGAILIIWYVMVPLIARQAM